jgi:hypothetical protein
LTLNTTSSRTNIRQREFTLFQEFQVCETLLYKHGVVDSIHGSR